jgi:hypothetical protein
VFLGKYIFNVCVATASKITLKSIFYHFRY